MCDSVSHGGPYGDADETIWQTETTHRGFRSRARQQRLRLWRSTAAPGTHSRRYRVLRLETQRLAGDQSTAPRRGSAAARAAPAIGEPTTRPRHSTRTMPQSPSLCAAHRIAHAPSICRGQAGGCYRTRGAGRG